MRVEVQLVQATIHNRKEIDEKSNISELGVSYKVDNGKEYFDSLVVNELEKPNWSDTFQLSIMNESEIIFFQLLLHDRNTDTLRVIDSFDIRGSEIINGLDATKTFRDTIITNWGNEYSVIVKKKGDEISKLKAIDKKIQKQQV